MRLHHQVLSSQRIWARAEYQRSLWVRAKGMAPSKLAPTPPQICVSEGTAHPWGGDTASPEFAEPLPG